MSENDIPKEVKKLINKYIDSLDKLEILLLFYNNSSKNYTVEEITNELRGNSYTINIRLKELYKEEFISKSDEKSYIYNKSNSYDRVLLLLNNAYNNFKHTVIHLIFSKPLDNITSFADAFKFTKDDD